MTVNYTLSGEGDSMLHVPVFWVTELMTTTIINDTLPTTLQHPADVQIAIYLPTISNIFAKT